MDKNDFELSTLPALIPVLSSASGETLLLLVKHADLIIHKVILLVKQAMVPRVHGLSLKTTVAAVSRVKVSSASTNGLHSEPLPKSVAQNSSTKSRASWDEDWGPTVKKTANASQPLETNIQPEESLSISQQATANAIPLQSVAAAPTHQMPTTCTPVDIEWPPSNSYSEFGAQLNVNEKQNSMDVSNSAFDDLDPFANWPPKPSNSASSLGSATVPTQSHGISGSGMSSKGFSSISTSVGQSNLHKGSLISNVNNPRGLPMNSQTFGQVNRASASVIGNSVSALETSHPNSNSHAFKSTDIGSIFAPVHNGQPTPRIAPPPTTAIGRGRGRNQGNARVSKASRSGHGQGSSEQPPLLDLL
ncbi:hypothetical protein BHM03_00007598 [Ensete ventricosum]|nr:hypothetical protein BHM03_00007598 [Ensete ventricosum]